MADEVAKYKPEDYMPKMSEKAIEFISDFYTDYYKFRSERDSSRRQFQGKNLEDTLRVSREVFWNSTKTDSEDLEALGLDFSLPFTRKEVMDFVGRIVTLRLDPKIMGDNLDTYGVKVLQAIYKKWRMHSNDEVEKFWQVLYGATNGTVCTYVGFDGDERESRILTQYDPETGKYKIETKKNRKYNDVFSEIVPLEDIYLAKIWERNIQKQGKVIRKHQMTWSDFKKQFPVSKYPLAEYVRPGNMIDEQSLFFQLLGGSGVTETDKIEVLKATDTDNDEYGILANGIWINKLGRDTVTPLPFTHKMQPFAWSITNPQDEKFAYGVPTPFLIKDIDRILNTSQTMMVERELRTIDPPILTSDFEAPDIIFGDKRIVPVNDINAYKEIAIAEPSGQFFTMQNSLQGLMSSFVQGGMSQVAPSRQPKAAREIIELNEMKKQALGNALIMYYDLVRQELLLVLKTALQFYETGKYADQTNNLIRAITVPNFPLSQGGSGNVEVRIVREPQDALKLYFEAVNKSIDNGKLTEIIEVPVEMLNNLEFFIESIKLEPESASELEKASWNEQVLKPLVEVFIPAGVASIEKTFLRWAEKNDEHPADFASDNALGGIVQTWGNQYKLPQEGDKPAVGATTGNLNQSTIGTTFGSQSNGGLGALTP